MANTEDQAPLLPGQINIGGASAPAGRGPASELAAPAPEPEERELEAALRPKNLDDFVGQERVRKQLALVLAACAHVRAPRSR